MFVSYGRRLAEGLSNLISAYGANFVVIGGSGSNYFPFYGPSMREHLLEIQDCFPIPIVGAQLGADGGAIGAALLGRDIRANTTTRADVDRLGPRSMGD
jgi:predicted NBD/HSP70 family sugar kinase